MAGEAWQIPDEETYRGERIWQASEDVGLQGMLRAEALLRGGVPRHVTSRIKYYLSEKYDLDKEDIEESILIATGHKLKEEEIRPILQSAVLEADRDIIDVRFIRTGNPVQETRTDYIRTDRVYRTPDGQTLYISQSAKNGEVEKSEMVRFDAQLGEAHKWTGNGRGRWQQLSPDKAKSYRELIESLIKRQRNGQT